jgi:hypothetical protein
MRIERASSHQRFLALIPGDNRRHDFAIAVPLLRGRAGKVLRCVNVCRTLRLQYENAQGGRG